MKRFALLMGLCLSLAAVSYGCSKKQRALTSEQKQELSRYVGSEATKPKHPLDIKFGESVALIGYDVDVDKVVPGQPFNVTFHFRVDKALGGDWKLFTHLADAAGTSRINGDDKGKLRTMFPASAWESGTYVRDPLSITLPEDWDSDGLIIFLGFWQDDDRMPVTGPSDHDNRARAFEIKVERKEPVVPELHATYANAPITLDGKLDEATWGNTGAVQLVNTMTGVSELPRTNVKTAWDDNNLYVAFDVQDDILRSTFTSNDDHLWEQDCVEIMVDPDGDGNNYVELQVSPANKKFDTRYETRRAPRPYGLIDYDSELKSAVSVRGTLNDAQLDEGYTVEIAIPWSAFAKGEPKHDKPSANSTWRLNYFVLDSRNEHDQRAVGWSPPRVGDFHVPRRFGTVIFDAPRADAVADSKAATKGGESKAKKAAPAKAPEKTQ
jgi:hypothetical protein